MLPVPFLITASLSAQSHSFTVATISQINFIGSNIGPPVGWDWTGKSDRLVCASVSQIRSQPGCIKPKKAILLAIHVWQCRTVAIGWPGIAN